jgi:plastocyanin
MSYSAIAMTRHALVLVCLAALDPAAHAGSVKGTVLFEGEAPENKTPKREADPKCGKDRPDEAVVVTKGKLRDVVVRIKNGSTGAHDAPKDPVVLDQHGCDYVPRVVGIVAGQKVVVKNSDATFHNVWGQVAGKDLVNKQQGPKAADLTIDPAAAKPGDVVELKCGIHPWMHAYVAVQDSPYFAVTDAEGKFEIKDLPVGTYTLEAWHPTLGEKSLQIVIGKGKRGDVTARFSYKP